MKAKLQVLLQALKSKLQALWAGLKSQLLDIWNRSKMFLLAGLTIAIYLGWNSLKEMVLAYFGKKEIQQDNKQDATLKAKEDSANNQADALAKKAQKEPNPGDDWNKNE